MTWAAPNNLLVDIIGRREQSTNDELKLRSIWDRPVRGPGPMGLNSGFS